MAFEIRKTGEVGELGELIYLSSSYKFTVPAAIPLNEEKNVYAVQSDGKRVKCEELP